MPHVRRYRYLLVFPRGIKLGPWKRQRPSRKYVDGSWNFVEGFMTRVRPKVRSTWWSRVKVYPPPPPRAKSPSIVLNESTHIGRSTQALLSRRGNEDTNYTDTNYVTVIFIVFIGFLERLWITVWIGRGVFSGCRHKIVSGVWYWVRLNIIVGHKVRDYSKRFCHQYWNLFLA